MILNNVTVRETGKKQIAINGDRIGAILEPNQPATGERRVHFDDATVLPGLINSHDHIDFNLFPQLANAKYNNYREWGNDIHQHNKAAIDAVLKIPEALRTEWGLYKNLLNGFTTVVNHGKKINNKGHLISVFEDCYPLHSPGFERNWKWKLNNPFKTGKPFVMHIGEGTDTIAKQEIDEVIRGNWFSKSIIGIHGIQMDRLQAAAFTGLVWCPASNYFLLNKTAAIWQLKESLPVVFGTDSTLSAGWNAWQHFREGLSGIGLSESEMVDMLTATPAGLWGLKDRGVIATGKRADLVVIKNKVTLFTADPEDILLVMHKGEIRSYDESIATQLQWFPKETFSRVRVNNSVKFIQGDLPGLMEIILHINPQQQFPVSVDL